MLSRCQLNERASHESRCAHWLWYAYPDMDQHTTLCQYESGRSNAPVGRPSPGAGSFLQERERQALHGHACAVTMLAA